MNFTGTHYLNLSESRAGLVREADVILMLEVQDPWAREHGDPWKDVRASPNRTSSDPHHPRRLPDEIEYQIFQRFQPADLAISADAQTSIAPLTRR